MKKAITLSIFISLLTLQLHAQTEKYRVMAITGGTALHGVTNQEITPGTILDANDPIRFSSADVRILVYSNTQGRKIVRAEKAQPNREFLYLVAENLFQASDRSGTRSGEGIFNLSDLKNFFCTAGCILVLDDELKIRMPYLKDSGSFYYLNYLHASREYNIPLPYEEDSVVISKKNVFREIVPPGTRLMVKLYFYKSKSKESIHFCDLQLMFAESRELKDELEVINHLPCNQKIDEVMGYLVDKYGCNPVRHNVEGWVSRYLCK